MDQEFEETHEKRKSLLTNLLVILVLVAILYLSLGVVSGGIGLIISLVMLFSGQGA
jgi:phosphotransferase system  glucose/maltose/N-acetylglucosamine-specific IIC component